MIYSYDETIICPACKSSLDDAAGDYVILGRHAYHGEEVFEECPTCNLKLRITHNLEGKVVDVQPANGEQL